MLAHQQLERKERAFIEAIFLYFLFLYQSVVKTWKKLLIAFGGQLKKEMKENVMIALSLSCVLWAIKVFFPSFLLATRH